MAEGKHTAGPWAVSGNSVANGVQILTSTRNLGGCVEVICTMPRKGEGRTANARLIAAAPDLLAALREAEEGLASSYQVCDYPADGRSSQDDALRTVRAAIAKATGGQ